jgi:hypothetical protein
VIQILDWSPTVNTVWFIPFSREPSLRAIMHALRSYGGGAEKSGKGLNIPDIVALRLVAEGPDRHVCDHAAAKFALGD